MDETLQLNAEKYRAAAEAGDAEAQYQLALCYFPAADDPTPAILLTKEERRRGQRLGLQWFGKAAKQGHTKANTRMGICFNHKMAGCPQNKKTAFRYFKLAAEQGDPEAMYYLATLHLFYDAVEPDTEKGHEWCLKSAQAGYSWAQVVMSWRFSRKDPVAQIKWIELAAEQGNPTGLCKVAMAHESGQGVPKDKTKAYAFYSLFDKCWQDEARVGFKNKMRLKRQLTPEQIREGNEFVRQFSKRLFSAA
jgi:TPR repeat protein